MFRNRTFALGSLTPSRLLARFGLALLIVYALTGALCLLVSCASLLTPGAARSPSPSTVVDADSLPAPSVPGTAADASTTVPAAGSTSAGSGPASPNRSDFRPGRGGDKDYVRALQATAGPRKVKVTGSAAYAGPGATLAAATGKNAAAAGPDAQAVATRGADQVAPVLGDGNAVKLLPGQPAAKLPPDRFPASFLYWLLALAGLVVGYGLYRHFKTA